MMTLYTNTTDFISNNQSLSETLTFGILTATSQSEQSTQRSTENVEALSHNEKQTLQSVQTLLAVISLGLNILSLVIVYGYVPKFTPPVHLLTSFCFEQMLVAWAIMIVYFPESSCQLEIHNSLMLTGVMAVALTSLTRAVIHNIAIYKPLKYDRVTSKRRIWLGLVSIWVVAVLCGHVNFLISTGWLMPKDDLSTYCDAVRRSMMVSVLLTSSLCGIAVGSATFIYCKLFFHLRPVEALLSSDNCSSPKSTKGIVTGMTLLVLFTVVWTPYFVLKFRESLDDDRPRHDRQLELKVVQLFILLGSICDPVICGLRMSGLQLGYMKFQQQLQNWFRRVWLSCKAKLDHDELPSTPLNPIESIC